MVSVSGHKPRSIEVKQHPANSVQWGSVNSQVGKCGLVHGGLETNSMFVSGDLKMTFHCCRETAIYYSEANKLERIFCLITLVIDTRTGYYYIGRLEELEILVFKVLTSFIVCFNEIPLSQHRSPPRCVPSGCLGCIFYQSCGTSCFLRHSFHLWALGHSLGITSQS